MAVLSLAGISAVLLTYFFTYGSLERTALASHVPWLGNYLYAIIQAVIVIFLSGNFLPSDRKLDTTGVIWVRPVTNSAYIAGKVWGTIKVFFVLNIVTLLLVAYLRIAVVRSPFMLYPYVLYLFVISMPSLIFMLGLSCFVMSFVRSRALGYILPARFDSSAVLLCQRLGIRRIGPVCIGYSGNAFGYYGPCGFAVVPAPVADFLSRGHRF
ncbi:MAG: hypothetical protein ACLTSL_11200 [Odoribacter splanchnicus]